MKNGLLIVCPLDSEWWAASKDLEYQTTKGPDVDGRVVRGTFVARDGEMFGALDGVDDFVDMVKPSS